MLILISSAACAGGVHLVNDISAYRSDGAINAVIEIPAGTSAKYMVDHVSGELVWERRDGLPRVVDYLPYPGNYGMIPSTLLPAQDGGDGDPLDVIVLGEAVPRGTIMVVRVVGALQLRDDGERDDKLVAVPARPGYRGPFADIRTLSGLDARYGNVRRMLELWFSSYDREDTTELEGWLDEGAAMALLRRAEAAFQAGGPAEASH